MSRQLSVPERIGVLGIGVALAATAWPTVTQTTGLGLPCPLRSLTGVPCPGCGLTTASVALVRGDLTSALAANPAIVGLAMFALVVGPLLALRATGVLPPSVPWSPVRRRRTEWVAGLLALASWAFQLHRLGIG